MFRMITFRLIRDDVAWDLRAAESRRDEPSGQDPTDGESASSLLAHPLFGLLDLNQVAYR